MACSGPSGVCRLRGGTPNANERDGETCLTGDKLVNQIQETPLLENLLRITQTDGGGTVGAAPARPALDGKEVT